MNIEQFTLISINKETKEREEVVYFTTPELLPNLHTQIILENTNNYYIKIDTIPGYYILFNNDIHSHCLSIYKKVNSSSEFKNLINYTYKTSESVDEAIRLYEEEQERLRQEEYQESRINEEDIIEFD
jgi:hypothetical protein